MRTALPLVTRRGVTLLIALLWMTLASQTAAAQVDYQYTGRKFNYFSCGGNSLCQTVNPANTSYTKNDFVTATLTLAQPLPPNLHLQDVTGFAGFKLVMSDGHQQKTAAAASSKEVKVSTDAQGNLVAPWSVFIHNTSTTVGTLNWPGGRGIGDNGTLSRPTTEFPNAPQDSGHNILDAPGIWSAAAGGVAFGTAARVVRKGDFDDFFDRIDGDVGQLYARLFSGSNYGTETAYGMIKDSGLVVGSWSASQSGTARGIAFRVFRNNTTEAKTFRIKAVLNGRFSRAPWDLPTGPMTMGAAVRVFDPAVFTDRLKASGVSAGEFLLGNHTLSDGFNPRGAFAQLPSLFPGGVLGNGEVIRFGGPDGQPISVTVQTDLITVAPAQAFVVMFDLMTSSGAAGDVNCHGPACQPSGYGSVYFRDSLTPAPDFFTGADGNPVNGIGPLGPSESLPAAPTTLTLTQGASNGQLGGAHTVTAQAKSAGGAPVADAVVSFEVTGGPHVGLTGGGVTDANGQATFTYVGAAGVGTDTIRAQLGALESNHVQRAWQATGAVRFSQPTYTVQEAGTGVSITVERTGGATRPGTVDYTASDVSSSSRSDYTAASGTLFFGAGETSKTFTILVNEDSYAEGTEAFQLTLSNPTGDVLLGQPSLATLDIGDDSPETTGNPNDGSEEFVRQHYHDFLNREPDAEGLNFWTRNIEECGADAGCREVKRINVSAAFFLSIEFQETGYLAYRAYKAAYGDTTSPNVSVPVPVVRLGDFLADAQAIGRDVRVGIGDWRQQLEANKRALANRFVRRARFLAAHPLTLTPAQFVDRLDRNAGGVLTQERRDQLVAELSAETDVLQGRASVLLKVAEDPELRRRETTRAFVLMQYYGYLRRNPDDPQDTDFRGWEFWLGKLNQFDGDFIQAEMVKAFISSVEYRGRFGQ